MKDRGANNVSDRRKAGHQAWRRHGGLHGVEGPGLSGGRKRRTGDYKCLGQSNTLGCK